MGLPGFLGSSVGPIKAKSAKKNAGLLGWGSKIRSSRAQSKLRGSDKKISEGEGCLVSGHLKERIPADFDDITLKRCVKSIRRSDQLLGMGFHGNKNSGQVWVKNVPKIIGFCYTIFEWRPTWLILEPRMKEQMPTVLIVSLNLPLVTNKIP